MSHTETRSTRGSRAPSLGAVVESMEARRLLTTTYVDGVVTIEGTQQADRIFITYSSYKYNVSVNGVIEGRFSTSTHPITRFEIYSGEGDDFINTEQGPPLLVYAGDGDDTVNGSQRLNDTIYGEGGNDTLNGGYFLNPTTINTCADYIEGGEGDDTISGDSGHDTLLGGAGFDHIDAGSGNDVVYGDADDDYIDGASGNDTLWGGDGNDEIIGSGGKDLLYGEAGNDVLRGAWNNDLDTLDGGDGDDTYEADPVDVILN